MATGVFALDARIRVDSTRPAGAAHFAITPYPAELTETIEWQGERIVVRPIRPEDGPQHRAFIEQLESEDLRLRFFYARRDLPKSELARLTQIDYAREMAFIAVRPRADGGEETIGVVRGIADPDNVESEFAIVVRSDLKGHGLGQAAARQADPLPPGAGHAAGRRLRAAREPRDARARAARRLRR
jgi:acetyltransferase